MNDRAIMTGIGVALAFVLMIGGIALAVGAVGQSRRPSGVSVSVGPEQWITPNAGGDPAAYRRPALCPDGYCPTW